MKYTTREHSTTASATVSPSCLRVRIPSVSGVMVYIAQDTAIILASSAICACFPLGARLLSGDAL